MKRLLILEQRPYPGNPGCCSLRVDFLGSIVYNTQHTIYYVLGLLKEPPNGVRLGYKTNEDSGLTDAQERVLAVVEELEQASPHSLHGHPGIQIGKVMLQRHLKRLVELGKLEKTGKPPRVFYELAVRHDRPREWEWIQAHRVSDSTERILRSCFAFTDEKGFHTGVDAFCYWFLTKQVPVLKKQKSRKTSYPKQVEQNFAKLLQSYVELRQNLAKSLDPDLELIEATDRYLSIHATPSIDRVFYLDFYSLPQFGKTLNGYLVQKAKVGDVSSLKYIDILVDILQPKIRQLVGHFGVDACLWVPHSLKRKVSLQDLLAQKVVTGVPRIKVEKIFREDTVPQKTISDLGLRLKNAKNSNLISEPLENLKNFKTVLIVDDAIGSNATIHVLGEKLKRKSPDLQLLALAPIGSFKGFDVITDI